MLNKLHYQKVKNTKYFFNNNCAKKTVNEKKRLISILS